ncbi:pre-mRNA splicing prp18-interacting factor domain-containing protein [Ditylenchus destructor]|uniref:Pre-mRNA-splicing factor SLU7 n=1 Tax=Ditylenchus destructor TaxID=166010 RepID=A0AAD4NAA8_9BILA|nr:pre-mRNA splicing prp18-interacting factor domain-containing protein [Ditylenchus destructor]
MGHAKKQCMEKPRAVGAKYSNTNIASDDTILHDLELDFDAKRDRWSGYDSNEYKKVQNEFEKAEEIRKIIKAQNVNVLIYVRKLNSEYNDKPSNTSHVSVSLLCLFSAFR